MPDEQVRVCIDRVVPDEYNPARAASARGLAERIASLDPNMVVRPKLALPVAKMWENGTEIKCRFLDGTPKQKKKVEAKAHLWEQFANITLKFVTLDRRADPHLVLGRPRLVVGARHRRPDRPLLPPLPADHELRLAGGRHRRRRSTSGSSSTSSATPWAASTSTRTPRQAQVEQGRGLPAVLRPAQLLEQGRHRPQHPQPLLRWTT